MGLLAPCAMAVVAGKRFASFVTEPPPSYMRDDVPRPTYDVPPPAMPRSPRPMLRAAPSDTVGFDAVVLGR